LMRFPACLAAAALAALALALPATATAKCALLSESESRQVSDVVFEGVVGGQVGDSAEATLTPGKPATVRRFDHFRFRVARYLQGQGQDNVEVTRPFIADSYPRANPRPGEAWRVYAHRTPRGLFFSPCVPYTTRLVGVAVARVRQLLASNPGPEIQPGGGADDDGGIPLALVIGIGAVVLAAAGLLATRLRRPT
jgi:hypothetical protein